MDILSAIFTVTTIIILIYFRINRTIFYIPITPEYITTYYTFFCFMFIYSSFFLLLFLVLFLLAKKNKQSKFIITISIIFQKYNPFLKGYTYIFEKLTPNGTKYLVNLVRFVVKLSENAKKSYIFSFLVLPRVTITLVLFLDLFYFYALHFYYYSLLLLLFPFIFRFIIFILTDISSRMLPAFKDMLVFEETHKTLVLLSVKLKPEYNDIDLDDLLYNFYYPLVKIDQDMKNIVPIVGFYNYISQLFYFFFHALFFALVLV